MRVRFPLATLEDLQEQISSAQHMFYVYVLRSLKDQDLYIGATIDLRKRFREHNSGLDKSTKYRRPFIILFYEAFTNKSDAFNREKYLKTGWGRKHLRHALVNALKEDKRACP